MTCQSQTSTITCAEQVIQWLNEVSDNKGTGKPRQCGNLEKRELSLDALRASTITTALAQMGMLCMPFPTAYVVVPVHHRLQIVSFKPPDIKMIG